MRSIAGQSQEWAGLLTFTFNRRIEALEEIHTRLLGVEYSLAVPLGDRIDSTLMAPFTTDADANHVTNNLTRLLSLSPEDHDVISAAIQMHYSACLLSTRETNAAYALLVGALELLSKRFGTTSSAWDDWSESSRWEGTFRKGKLNDDQKSRMRKALLADNKHRNLKRRFVDYALSSIPLEFWSEPIQDWSHEFDASAGTITGGHWEKERPRFIAEPTETIIRNALSGAYQARSSFVHEGRRTVDLVTEMSIQVKPDEAPRLPFRATRDALRFLISAELERASPTFNMPNVIRA
ncbi:hypothetical protein [Lentzea albida]|nr:hypothetical protein [Lentzea albida]